MASVKNARNLVQQVQAITGRLEEMLEDRIGREAGATAAAAHSQLPASDDQTRQLRREIAELQEQREVIKKRLDQLITVIEEALSVN